MSIFAAELRRRWLPGRGLSAALAMMCVYFGVTLVPEWRPGLAGTGVFFIYVLSIPFTLLGLLGLAIWGMVGAIAAHRQGSPIRRRHRISVVLFVAGVVIFASTMVLARVIKGTLPTGSHVLEFAPAVWREQRSSEFVQGDITPRQKMLGSLVKRFGQAQDRAELEALLGPSLDTPYFASTGRDLIYLLGPERDSFFAIDSEWLLIWLDDSGHFARYEIHTD
jgi:hypothetical protein